MRNYRKYLAAILLLAAGVTSAVAIPSKPNPPRLVNDYAGVFHASQRMALERKLTAFDDSTSNQITVVTVNDLEGYSPAEYGTEIGLRWEVGSKNFDNGIVVLVKPKTAGSDGQVNISVGYGLEGAIPDSYAKRIINNEMIPAFSRGDYFAGVDNACTVLMQLASGEIDAPRETTGSGSSMWIVLFLILFLIILFRGKNNRKGRRNNGNNRVTVVLNDHIFNQTVQALNRYITLGQILFPVLFILMGVLGFVVSWLMVNGRRMEFAIMRGLGASRGRVFCSFFLEQGALALLGCILGGLVLTIAGAGWAGWLAATGFLVCYLIGCALAVLAVGRTQLMSLLSERE